MKVHTGITKHGVDGLNKKINPIWRVDYMRLTATLAGLFLCAVIFSANTDLATAEIENDKLVLGEIRLEEAIIKEFDAAGKAKKSAKPIIHTISEGETLLVIAEQYGIEWKRIYDKNTAIDNPDIINPGEKIIIPGEKEKLKERVIPVIQPQPVGAANNKTASSETQVSTKLERGSSSGNGYSPGYCTYYAKQRRPDLPNNLGNAATWVSRASAQGIPTGATPKVGAIGQSGNHVVYVEKLNSNGTIVVSDMNWSGLWVVTTRTVSAGSHTYIY